MSDAEIVAEFLSAYRYMDSLTDGGRYYLQLDDKVRAEFDRRLKEESEKAG